MPKAKRMSAGEPTRSPAPAAIDLDAVFALPALDLPRKEVPEPTEPAVIEWGDVVPERVIAAYRKENDWVKKKDLETALAKFREEAALQPTTCTAIMSLADDDLLLEILGMPPQSFIFWDEDDVDFVLARLGERAIAPLRTLHEARKIADVAMLRIRAPFVALIAAAHLSVYFDERVRHHEWLLSHAELATKALLHTVLTGSDEGHVREDACEGLRFLSKRDSGAMLQSIAKAWGVTTGLETIALPRLIGPQKSKVPKAWGAIPAPLPGKGLEMVLGFLASEPPASHPYTQRVLAALDAEALRGFVSAMMHAWTSRGSASTHMWLVHADALVFGDAGLRRAGAWGRTKSTSSSRNERNRCGRALDVLDRFAGSVATAQISDIATLAKTDWLRAKAERALQVRMLTSKEDLDDILERAMPDLGFGEGGIVLDGGARKFTAKARSDLSLVLVDETGATIEELPRPRKSDDAKLAKAAVESWRTLRADVDGVAKVARARLENAMRTGRSWPRDRFLAHVVGHPLMRMLAQGVVWRAAGGKSFRVAEDGSLADLDDRAFELPDAPVTLVHPSEISKEERDAWTARFQEYEVLPPIDQLARVTFDAAPEKVLEACKGWTISAGAIFGLLREGWRPIYEEGVVIGVVRSLGSDRKASVVFSPGIVLKEVDASEKLKLHALSLTDAFLAHERARIDLSEVLRDLAGHHHRNPSITSKASS
jgi:hypothetical protein